MKADSRASKSKAIIILLVTFGIALYLVSLKVAYPLFQNTRLINPLASIHSLFPLYYGAIVIVATAGFISFIGRIRNAGIHILLLLILAIILWYTPYYLAGFVYQPDGPWHVGVAMRIPEVFAGEPIAFSWYARGYPSSFVFHYVFLNTLGVEPLIYMSRFFPLLFLCLFILLCYAFLSRLFNPRLAFLSLLLAIPGLHYIQLHPSPHAIGVLLVLMTLIFLLKKGIVCRAMMFLTIIVTISCHYISPLILLVFLGAALITSFLMKNGTTRAVLATTVAVCFIGWSLWLWLSFAPGEETTQTRTMIGAIFTGELTTTGHYLLGTPFIYGGIYSLNKGIYFLYAAIAAILLLRSTVTAYLKQRDIKKWASRLGGVSRSQLFLALSLPLFLILTILLAEWGHDLIERGLTFIILILSCLIASMSIRFLNSKLFRPAMLILVLFLTLSFPIVAYSIDAYTSFPESEKSGLEFIVAKDLVTDKTLDGTRLVQLVLYRSDIREPDYMETPDIFIFRSTDYYYRAMRLDLSFDDNLFIRYLGQIRDDNKYNKIYSSLTTEIYKLY